MKRNHTNPLNPADPLKISPEDYEREVLHWLSETSDIAGTTVEFGHRQMVEGHGGDYEIDITGEFSVLEGATIRILIECKRHKRPVERDVVAALVTKIRDTSSHKGMIFSVSGFQRGALELAKSEGIAAITFVDGQANYFTKSLGPTQTPPSWDEFPKCGGWFLTMEGNTVHSSWVAIDRLDPIAQWIGHGVPTSN